VRIPEQFKLAGEYEELWRAVMPDVAAPSVDQFVLWAGNYPYETVVFAINRAARKQRGSLNTGVLMSSDSTARYASGVMFNQSNGNRKFPSVSSPSSVEREVAA
jgi:hypothetical protein